MKNIVFILMIALSTTFFLGCEKLSNTAKNIQSDWVGLDRKIEIYSCHTGVLIKSYTGSVRINPEYSDTSLLINGKKLHTNMCYIIQEIGIKQDMLRKPMRQDDLKNLH